MLKHTAKQDYHWNNLELINWIKSLDEYQLLNLYMRYYIIQVSIKHDFDIVVDKKNSISTFMEKHKYNQV